MQATIREEQGEQLSSDEPEVQAKVGKKVSEGDIERMVLKPTWKEVLMEMIVNERLDPWNIDITILADGFMKRVKEMKTLELHVPANIILAAAILLKYKSNALRFEPEILPSEEIYENSVEEIPRLELVSRIPPKGPITIEDIMGEMERVMKYDEPKPKPIISNEMLTMPAPKFDIEEGMDRVLKKVEKKVDAERWTTFSELLEEKSTEEIIYTLLPLLHLSQRKTVDLKQDKFFGEIFIRLN